MSQSITYPTSQPTSESLAHAFTHFPPHQTIPLLTQPKNYPRPQEVATTSTPHQRNHPISNKFTQPLTYLKTPSLPPPSITTSLLQ